MVKEIIIPKENKAQIEEVREIETNQLTEKDFFIGCPDEDDISINEKGVKIRAREAAGKIDDDFDAGISSTETKASADIDGGLGFDTKIGASVAGHKDDEGEVEFGKVSAEGKLGVDEESAAAKIGVRADAVDVDTEAGFKANLGVKDETGVEAKDGTVEADVEGFGVKVGKEIGFETPIGGASIDLEKAGEKIGDTLESIFE